MYVGIFSQTCGLIGRQGRIINYILAAWKTVKTKWELALEQAHMQALEEEPKLKQFDPKNDTNIKRIFGGFGGRVLGQLGKETL